MHEFKEDWQFDSSLKFMVILEDALSAKNNVKDSLIAALKDFSVEIEKRKTYMKLKNNLKDENKKENKLKI